MNKRQVKNSKGSKIDYVISEALNRSYETTFAGKETLTLSVLCSSSGNRDGKVKVAGANRGFLAMALGKSESNNAKISFHFTLEWLANNEDKFEAAMVELSNCIEKRMAKLQSRLTKEQLKEGKSIAMTTKALKDARNILSETQVVEGISWEAVAQKYKALASSTLSFKHSMKFSVRVATDNNDVGTSKGYKNTEIKDSNGNSQMMNVRNSQASGVKSMPIFDVAGREEMDDMIYEFAERFLSELEKVGCVDENWTYNEDEIISIIKLTAVALTPTDKCELKTMEYTGKDLEAIQKLTAEIIKEYHEE